jgi:hypothetical protein
VTGRTGSVSTEGNGDCATLQVCCDLSDGSTVSIAVTVSCRRKLVFSVGGAWSCFSLGDNSSPLGCYPGKPVRLAPRIASAAYARQARAQSSVGVGVSPPKVSRDLWVDAKTRGPWDLPTSQNRTSFWDSVTIIRLQKRSSKSASPFFPCPRLRHSACSTEWVRCSGPGRAPGQNRHSGSRYQLECLWKGDAV